MGKLSTKFYEVLQTHLETDVPVQDLHLSEDNQKRILICMDVYKQMEDNPQMNITQYLRTRHKRTPSQIAADKDVINYLIAQLSSDTKELSRYRIKRAAEKAMAAGDAMGDMKTLLDGAKMLFKAEGLDKPESMLEDLSKSVHALPPVFTTDVTKINSDLTNITDEQKEKLLRKYNVQKDKTQEMVEAKMGFFVPAGSELTYEECAEEEENMFDQYDPDEV